MASGPPTRAERSSAVRSSHILAVEDETQPTLFAGNYQEYEDDRKKRPGEEGAKPKRIRYRPIIR